MQHRLKEQVKPFLKLMKLDVPYYLFKTAFFINKVAVVVEKDLSALTPIAPSCMGPGVALAEITPAALSREALVYPEDRAIEDRREKAIHYLAQGYRGYALVKEGSVCGDIWYVDGNRARTELPHPDLKWLGVRCGARETYAFDMHLYRQQRGNNLATLLQNGALHELRKQGFSRVYGYYWADNVAALWVHRTLRFRELKRIKVSKVLFLHHYQ